MIERSPEVTEFKSRLHKLSKQRFSAEITDDRMRDTLLKMLEQFTGAESTPSATSAEPETKSADPGMVEDDIGPVMKAVLVGLMLAAVGLIVSGIFQG